MLTPTDAEKFNWARLAQAAYKAGDTFTGHRYSAYAALPRGTHLSEAAYDGLQINYRRWLLGDLHLCATLE